MSPRPRTRQDRTRPLETRPHRRVAIVTLVLAVALVVVVLASVIVGQFTTSPDAVFASIGRWVGHRFATHPPSHDASRIDAVLWTIRFPRAVMAVLVGACLGVGGAVMQGVFGNPLAEPSIVGVSFGGSVGAAITIVAGLTLTDPWALPSAAFVGAIVAALVVWALARSGGRTAVLMLVLTGIAVNAIATAATSLLIFLGDASSRQQIIFWQLGTLAGSTWRQVGIVAAIFAVGMAGCVAIRRQLDVLSLGDAAAGTSGIRIDLLRGTAMLFVCLLTGAAVAFSGVIMFVGLIIPHAIRLAVGPSHRYLIPLSALGGAVLVSLADIAARTVIPFADLPIGIFTAVVGGPVFLVLLRRTLRGQGIDQ